MRLELLWIFGGVSVLAVLLWLGFGYLLKRAARQTLVEFARDFPGKCPICSYHAFGVQGGYTPAVAVKPHACIEKP